MDRTTIAWTLVVFFGATVVFGLIREAAEGESAGVVLGLQVLALVAIVAALVLWVRRRG